MAKSRGVTNRSLSVLPLLVMGASHLSFPRCRPCLNSNQADVRMVPGRRSHRRGGVSSLRCGEGSRIQPSQSHAENQTRLRGRRARCMGHGCTTRWNMDPLNKHGLTRSVGEISGEGPEMELGDEAKSKSKCSAKRPHRQSQRPSYRKCNVGRRNRCWYHGCQQENRPWIDFWTALWSVWRRQQGRTRGSASARLRQAAAVSPVTANVPWLRFASIKARMTRRST